MMDLSPASSWLEKKGIYGPVTATLDWCEPNFQFTPYVAEVANTFSNLYTFFLSILSLIDAAQEPLPTRYLVGYLGVALVGIGSFAFHATLLFQAQLADELPMIYVGSVSLWLLFDDEPGFSLRSRRAKCILAILIIFDILFTWSYYLYRNPIYHQVVFASIVFADAFRVTYILKYTDASHRIPQEKKNTIGVIFSSGAAMFAIGFLIWNLDNIFCNTLTQWKVSIGWPLAFLLEGHSWWHIFTGAGTYFMFCGIQYLTLCVKDDPNNYTLHWKRGHPQVKRIRPKTL